MESIRELVKKLVQQPQVIALVEYGSATYQDNFDAGDYDLFVILDQPDESVESLHFYVQHTPVDLNFRTLAYLQQQRTLSGFEAALLSGRIIYDESGQVEALLNRLQEQPRQSYAEHDVAFTHHGHKHVFDKIRGRLESDPLLCQLLLHTNVYWLIQTYFGLCGREFRGEKEALHYLQRQEPALYQLLNVFYKASLPKQIEISQRLSQIVLEPVGGPWRDDEILAFGEEMADLQERGRALYKQLFEP